MPREGDPRNKSEPKYQATLERACTRALLFCSNTGSPAVQSSCSLTRNQSSVYRGAAPGFGASPSTRRYNPCLASSPATISATMSITSCLQARTRSLPSFLVYYMLPRAHPPHRERRHPPISTLPLLHSFLHYDCSLLPHATSSFPRAPSSCALYCSQGVTPPCTASVPPPPLFPGRPARKRSTAAAAPRPSAMAHTTRD